MSRRVRRIRPAFLSSRPSHCSSDHQNSLAVIEALGFKLGTRALGPCAILPREYQLLKFYVGARFWGTSLLLIPPSDGHNLFPSLADIVTSYSKQVLQIHLKTTSSKGIPQSEYEPGEGRKASTEKSGDNLEHPAKPASRQDIGIIAALFP